MLITDFCYHAAGRPGIEGRWPDEHDMTRTDGGDKAPPPFIGAVPATGEAGVKAGLVGIVEHIAVNKR